MSEYDQEMLQSETAVDHPQISEGTHKTQTAHIILNQSSLSSITREDGCSTRKDIKNRTTKQGPSTKHISNLIKKNKQWMMKF